MFFWLMPFVSDLTMGNDYPRWSIWEQMELMFSLKTGSFPLYIPGYACGLSASALTLGQAFHPISYIAAILPGYWDGNALEWNTFLRLVSLASTHLALFLFLRKLKLNRFMSFLLSMVTVYHLRMLDLFRYGASLESWTGHLFLCAAIGFYYLNPTKKGLLLIIGSTYLLVCSGHPQMMYYGLIGAGLFSVITPYFVAVMLPDKRVDNRIVMRFYSHVSICCGLGILLSFAYILPFYFDFLAANEGRFSQGYAWADTYGDTFMGTVNNFFQPLRTDVGNGFGGSSLFLAGVLLPVLRMFKVKIPRVIWIVWGLIIVVFLYMQGGRTPVHYLAWKFLPFASSFRCAGRISIIMPILFMLLLVWIIQAETFNIRYKGHTIKLIPAVVLSAAALLLLGGYTLIPDSITLDHTRYCALVIREIPSWVESFVALSGMITLIALCVYCLFSKGRLLTNFFISFFAVIQIMCLLYYGTWTESKKATPGFKRMIEQKQQELKYLPFPSGSIASGVVMKQIKRSCMEPFLGKVYKSYIAADDNESAYGLIAQGRSPDQVIVENYKAESPDSLPGPEKSSNHVALVYSSFNRLVFKVTAMHPGFFGLAYPFTGQWKARVNDRKVRVYRANGAAHAVPIPPGVSHVEFRYFSKMAFFGMGVSCITFVLISVLGGFYFLKKPYNILVSMVFIAMGVGGYNAWSQSLYTGDNLNTVYKWESKTYAAQSNLAFEKMTSMSSLYYQEYADWPWLFNSGLAVDGNYEPKSGFITNIQHNPWWMIDLNKPEAIDTIKIYESRYGEKWNARPLVVKVSVNGKEWQIAGKIQNKKTDGRFSLEFENPLAARYVVIQASGFCRLAFDEVEIYSHDRNSNNEY